MLGWTFGSIFAGLLLLAVVAGSIYTSHMSILVNRERLDPLVSPESSSQMITTNTPITEEEINSEIELLKSRDVLEQVVLANGMENPDQGWSLADLLHPHQTREDRIARSVKALAQSLKIKSVSRSNLIEVEFSSPDPQHSFGVLNALGGFYMQKHVQVHRPAGSYDVFVRETQRYRDLLDQAENKLRQFTQQAQVAAPEAQESSLAAQVATTIGQTNLAEQSFAADEMRLADDRQQMEKTPMRAPTVKTSAAPDKLLDQLHETLLDQENRKSHLLQTYDPGYPLVHDIELQIAQVKTAIAAAGKLQYMTESTDNDPVFEALRVDISRTQADRAAQAASIAAGRSSIRSMEAKLVDLDAQSMTRQDLLRDVTAAEHNYLTYLGKREQERTSNALDSTRIANVAIAVPPVVPVLPVFGWPVLLLGAFAIAVVLSIGSAYAADYFDTSFYTAAQVADDLGIPVVIQFPSRVA